MKIPEPETPKFEVGDLVTTKVHINLPFVDRLDPNHDLPNVMQIIQCNVEYCPGGVQVSYLCRMHSQKKYDYAIDVARDVFRFNQVELISLEEYQTVAELIKKVKSEKKEQESNLKTKP